MVEEIKIMGFAIAGAAVLGGALSSSSAQNAANAQSQAADRASQEQAKALASAKVNSQAYVDQGTTAINALGAGTSGPNADLTRQFTMNDFHQDPGYQFQLAQGTQAMDRSAAARGMLNSAGTMEGINAYGQGMANSDYQQALTNFTNNQQQRYNMYAGIAGMGNTANGNMAQIGMNAANQTGNNMMGAANASGAAGIASSNAMMGGANSLANGYMNYNMMNKFAPQQQQAPGYGNTGSYTGADINGSSQLSGSEMGSSFAPAQPSMVGSLTD